MRRKRIALVQQGVWAMPLESMPLAIGYMKAAIDADEILREEFETEIVNFRGETAVGTAIAMLFGETVPDVVAISVFGWNFREALVLSETFKQLNPAGLVVLGGTHVANQGERVFRLCPEVDVIVNGEGEQTLPELLRTWVAGDFPQPGGEQVAGISFRLPDGTVVTTKARPGIADLSEIVSPFLTNSIPMTDAAGRFRYDVAIMESNRGCPYHCAFCYWGGAIGQKFRNFPRERLLAELEIFAYYKVDSVIVCDSNFGMQAHDEEFLEDVIKLRERTGYPRSLEASWTKNKSQIFYRIVQKMKDGRAAHLVHDRPADPRRRRAARHEPAQHEAQRLEGAGPVAGCRRAGHLRRDPLGRAGGDHRVLPARLRRAVPARAPDRGLPADGAAEHRLLRPAEGVRAGHRPRAGRRLRVRAVLEHHDLSREPRHAGLPAAGRGRVRRTPSSATSGGRCSATPA